MSNDVMAQLALLKGLTSTTGVLHDVQVVNLRQWPLMIIPDSTKAEVEFDFKFKLVTYKVKRSKKAKIKDLDVRMDTLAKYTRTLLGDEYQIAVYVNNGLIFSSEQNVE